MSTKCVYSIADDTTRMQHLRRQLETKSTDFHTLMQVFNALRELPDFEAAGLLARLRLDESIEEMAASLEEAKTPYVADQPALPPAGETPHSPISSTLPATSASIAGQIGCFNDQQLYQELGREQRGIDPWLEQEHEHNGLMLAQPYFWQPDTWPGGHMNPG